MFNRKIFIKATRPFTWLRARLSRKWEHAFYDALFAMLAKLCHADGDSNGDALNVVSAFISAELQFKPKKKMSAMSAFRKGRSSPQSFEDFARAFHKMCGPGTAIREAMIDLLLAVAAADNNFSHNEARLVEAAVSVFGLSERTYEKLKRRHLTPIPEQESQQQQEAKYWRNTESFQQPSQQQKQLTELELAYQTLESDPSTPLSEIKTRYRQLAKRYHPDSHAHANVPEEVIEFCEARFRELQVAYDLIQKVRSDE